MAHAHNSCGSCGYERAGLATEACCPECGKHSWKPSEPREIGTWIQRAAVSAIPACIAGVVAGTGVLFFYGADDVLRVVSVAIFPHAVSFVLFLWMTRTLSINKTRRWAVVLGGACAVVMAAVMVASRIWPRVFVDDVINHGNLTMVSALYFWTFVVIGGVFGARALYRAAGRLGNPRN